MRNIIVMVAASVIGSTVRMHAEEQPRVWGLDPSIIAKYERSATELFKICTFPAQEWRNHSYPELPAGINRLPVPGGQYKGFWYWDSCFTGHQFMQINSQYSVAMDVFKAFCWQLDSFGKIDNEILVIDSETNHPRSQMPLFIWLADSLYKVNADMEFLETAYSYGKKEMKGFWLNTSRERPRFDPELNLNHNDTDDTTGTERDFRSISASYEHGWDHGSRWRARGELWMLYPVDLNAVLYFNEATLARWAAILKDSGKNIPASEIAEWQTAAGKRKAAIMKYFYNAEQKYFFDYDKKSLSMSPFRSLAPSWLIWSGALDKEQVLETARYIEKLFIDPYALPPACLEGGYPRYGQSAGWSFPWSWSPVIQLMTAGFDQYPELYSITDKLVNKWLSNHGGMAEKYNAVNGGAGGARMLGWGLSVYFCMAQNYKLGFHPCLDKNLVVFRPHGITDGMGGRFNLHNRGSIEITYHATGRESLGAKVRAEAPVNVELQLSFGDDTKLSGFKPYLDGRKLPASQYRLITLDSEPGLEGAVITFSAPAKAEVMIELKKN